MGNKGRPRENCRETGRDSQVVKMMNMFLKKSEQGLGLLSKKVKSLSLVLLFATPWTVARQAPLSMGFSRQEYWSGLPFPSPGDLPNPGIKPGSPALQADASSSEPPGKPQAYAQAMLISLDMLHLGHPGSDLGGMYSIAPSCPTLYDPMDWSPPGSSVPGIL